MFCIPGFQQFDYDEPWCGFHCVYPACCSLNFLDMWVYSSTKFGIFSVIISLDIFVSQSPSFFPWLQIYICLEPLYFVLQVDKALIFFSVFFFGLCLVSTVDFKFTDYFFYRILVLLKPCLFLFRCYIFISRSSIWFLFSPCWYFPLNPFTYFSNCSKVQIC